MLTPDQRCVAMLKSGRGERYEWPGATLTIIWNINRREWVVALWVAALLKRAEYFEDYNRRDAIAMVDDLLREHAWEILGC